MMMMMMMMTMMMVMLAVCHRDCANGGKCVEPEVCQCVEPYVGVTCRENKQGTIGHFFTVAFRKQQIIARYNIGDPRSDQESVLTDLVST